MRRRLQRRSKFTGKNSTFGCMRQWLLSCYTADGPVGLESVPSIRIGALHMADNDVISNQKTILDNQKTILENQKTIVENQETIKKNQASLDKILANQEKILSHLSK